MTTHRLQSYRPPYRHITHRMQVSLSGNGSRKSCYFICHGWIMRLWAPGQKHAKGPTFSPAQEQQLCGFASYFFFLFCISLLPLFMFFLVLCFFAAPLHLVVVILNLFLVGTCYRDLSGVFPGDMVSNPSVKLAIMIR